MLNRRSFIHRTAAAVMGVVACVYSPVMPESTPSVYGLLCRVDGSLYVKRSEDGPWVPVTSSERIQWLRGEI